MAMSIRRVEWSPSNTISREAFFYISTENSQFQVLGIHKATGYCAGMGSTGNGAQSARQRIHCLLSFDYITRNEAKSCRLSWGWLRNLGIWTRLAVLLQGFVGNHCDDSLLSIQAHMGIIRLYIESEIALLCYFLK